MMSARRASMNGFNSWCLLPLSVWLLACMLYTVRVAAADSSLDQPRRFDIDAGSAESLLVTFSEQSGYQLLYLYESFRHVELNAVHGTFEPLDALDRMIAGTAVTYSVTHGRTLTLRVEREPSHATTGERRAASTTSARRRSRVDSGTSMDTVTIRSSIDSQKLEQTGSNLMTLRREDIGSTGFVSTQDIVRTVAQVFGGGPTEDTQAVGRETNTNITRGAGLNLRGLGASSTLVLLNGQRLAGSGSEALFVDVSNIPLTAVERLEVLPESASTFYGADAVGGVVNFVMRDSFEGAQTEGYFGTSTRGGLDESYVSQIAGWREEGSRGVVAIDYFSRDGLPAESRQLATSNLSAFGGDNFDTLLAQPANILFGTQFWAIPRGQDGTSLKPTDLLPGAPNTQDRYDHADVLPSQQRWGLFASSRWDIGKRLSAFADVLVGQRSARNYSGGYAMYFLVPSSNPYFVNPAGLSGPVQVAYNFFDDLGPLTTDIRVRTAHATQGIELQLESGWSVNATMGYASEQQRTVTENSVDSRALANSLADSNPATAFNAFGDGSHTSPETLARLRSAALFTGRALLKSASVLATGPIAKLPAGVLKFSLGGDYRHVGFSSSQAESASSGFFERKVDQVMDSASAELAVPLFDEPNARPGLQSLRLSFAMRYERYFDIGADSAPRLGVEWTPVRDLMLRGTYAESFRPPGVMDLDESQNVYAFYPMYDPQKGAASNVLIWAGKSRDLQQQLARSWTAGFQITPARLEGAAFALTYFDTSFTNRLTQPALSADLLSNPNLAALITRDPTPELRADVCSRAPLAGSALPCLGVPVNAIADVRLRNDATTLTRGIDLLVSSAFDTAFGKFRLRLNGTYVLEFSEAQASYLPMQNLVNTPHYPVNLRLRGSAAWQSGSMEVSASTNFTNSYRDTISLPNRNVGSWTTVDLHASYRFASGDGGLLDGTSIGVSIDNLFDRDPPFLNNSVGVGYDQENGDLLGRMVGISLRKKL